MTHISLKQKLFPDGHGTALTRMAGFVLAMQLLDAFSDVQ